MFRSSAIGFRGVETLYPLFTSLLEAVSRIEATHCILKDFTKMHKGNFRHISHKDGPGGSTLIARSFVGES